MSGRARFLSPRVEWGRFGDRKTQIELNRHFSGLHMTFSQVVNVE